MAIFLTSNLFTQIILPFVFVFTLIFAILDKSKLLGEEKRQINAILSFVVAGVIISFTTYVGWINKFIIVMVIAIVTLFVFMLIYGFIYGDTKGDPLRFEKWVKMTLGPVALLTIVAALLVITGWWDKIRESGDLGTNILIAIIIIVALVAVLGTGSGKKSSKEE